MGSQPIAVLQHFQGDAQETLFIDIAWMTQSKAGAQQQGRQQQ
jgi:hypothetical protein